MKILFVIYSLDAGGAERVVTLLANYWREIGHDVSIVILSKDEPFYELDKFVKLEKLDISAESVNVIDMIKNNIYRIQELKKFFKKNDPDVIVSFMTTTNIIATVAAKMLKKPIVISERNTFYALKSRVWRMLRRVVYPFSNALVVQSAYDKKKYSFHKNSRIIFNPLNSKQFGKKEKKKKVILAVGRLEYNKGFDLLIEAFAKISSDDWKLVIVGEGSQRIKLQKLMDSYNLKDKVNLPGRTKDIEKYYEDAKIFVLSSRHEGFPNVLCEAMAHGCAPIAFDCLTGPRDIINDKENGLLVENGNIQDLEKKIRYLMENPVKIDEYGRNALKIVEKLNIEIISQEWMNVIVQVSKV